MPDEIQIKAFCGTMKDGGFQIWMREDTGLELTEDTPVAEVSLDPLPYEAEGKKLWKLHSLYVPIEWRRQGMARRLMIAAIGMAERETPAGLCAVLYLDALPYERDDEPATVPVRALRRFYYSLGFEGFPGHPFSMINRRPRPAKSEGGTDV